MPMYTIFVLLGKVYDRVRQNLKLELPNSLILKYFWFIIINKEKLSKSLESIIVNLKSKNYENKYLVI